MIKKTIAAIMILTMMFFSVNINAGDELKTIPEYTALFGEMLSIAAETNIYESVNEKVLFEAAMEGMFSAIDGYSDLMTIEETEGFKDSIESNYVGIGVRLDNVDSQNIIIEVFRGSPSKEAGIRDGDIIISVDGVDTESYSIDALLEVLLGDEGTSVDLGIRRGLDEIVYTLTRRPITIPTVEELPISPDEIEADIADKTAYVRVNSFGQTTDFDFLNIVEELTEKGVEYLILDLRDNSGGYTNPAINMCKAIVPMGKVISFVDGAGEETSYYSTAVTVPFKQIVTLTNENTASSSEILTSAIQDSGIGITVGENTYGKGISQYFYQVDTDYYIKITGQEFYSRNDNKIHQVGIAPDVFVEVPSYITSNYRMYKGEDKEEVLQMEKVLSFLGYDVGVPDTVYDAKSHEAVYKFQADSGLHPYGICDYTTIGALNEALYLSLIANDVQLDAAIDWLENNY